MAFTFQTLKRYLPKTKTVRLLVATLLLTVGVYAAFPERESLASFPILFLLSIASFFFHPSFVFGAGAAFATAFVYGKMAGFSDFLFFSAFAALCAFCGCATAWALKMTAKKKYGFLLLVLPLVAAGVALPLCLVGTPGERSAAEEAVSSYLSEKYPDQTFSDLLVYYDRAKDGYTVTASYDFNGNTLTSVLVYADGVTEDGFLSDFSGWMQEERKSELINLLKQGSNVIYADSEKMTENPEEMTFRGSFGSEPKEMYPYLRFSVTFREEKPDKETFAKACREAVGLLREAEFSYGDITFRGLDAGRVAFECKVTPETTEEDVLSLIRYIK